MAEILDIVDDQENGFVQGDQFDPCFEFDAPKYCDLAAEPDFQSVLKNDDDWFRVLHPTHFPDTTRPPRKLARSVAAHSEGSSDGKENEGPNDTAVARKLVESQMAALKNSTTIWTEPGPQFGPTQKQIQRNGADAAYATAVAAATSESKKHEQDPDGFFEFYANPSVCAPKSCRSNESRKRRRRKSVRKGSKGCVIPAVPEGWATTPMRIDTKALLCTPIAPPSHRRVVVPRSSERKKSSITSSEACTVSDSGLWSGRKRARRGSLILDEEEDMTDELSQTLASITMSDSKDSSRHVQWDMISPTQFASSPLVRLARESISPLLLHGAGRVAVDDVSTPMPRSRTSGHLSGMIKSPGSIKSPPMRVLVPSPRKQSPKAQRSLEFGDSIVGDIGSGGSSGFEKVDPPRRIHRAMTVTNLPAAALAASKERTRKMLTGPMRCASPSRSPSPILQRHGSVDMEGYTSLARRGRAASVINLRSHSGVDWTRRRAGKSGRDSRGCKGTVFARDCRAQSEIIDDDQAAIMSILAQHNERVRQPFDYVPAMHSNRVIKEWERMTGHKWHKLSNIEREQANREMDDMTMYK